MAVQEAEDSDPEDEDDYEQAADNQNTSWTEKAPVTATSREKREVEWIGDAIKCDGKRTFYRYLCFIERCFYFVYH